LLARPPATFCQPSGLGGGSRTSNSHFTRAVLRADGTRAYIGYGVDSLTVGLVAVCRVKFAGVASPPSVG